MHHTGFWWGDPRERDLAVDGMIILKQMRQKLNGAHGLYLDDYRDRWWALVNAVLNLGAP